MCPPSDDADVALPIVGIGASAGGLEALEAFLRNVMPSSGLAYVVVQHLDPSRDALLATLLQRATLMPVVEVTDRMLVEADHVYVIPPNSELAVFGGRLYLLEPIAARGSRLPIDHFFRSLAAHSESSAVGVILSGMGSDGAQGVRAIKSHGGVALAQSPDTAAFNGMPQSAVETGVLDGTGLAEELPALIFDALRAGRRSAELGGASREPALDPADERGLEKVLLLLNAHCGQDFSQYKRQTVFRRIERRMALHQIGTLALYARYLQENPQESESLFKELLIGVTSFFRDAAAWSALAEQLPQLLVRLQSGEPFRAWVAACSTGEEAYTLAMLVHEAIEALHPSRRIAVQIFATDISRDAIDRARTGVYPNAISAELTSERIARWFELTDRGLQITKVIRDSVVFATHSVGMDPPFTKLDVLCCRNLLIYLTPALQRRLLPVFHYSLRPGGVLLLGSSESIGQSTDLFSPLGVSSRLYRRIETRARADVISFPTAAMTDMSEIPPKSLTSKSTLQGAAEQLLLRRFAPAAVLTDAKGDIVFISGRTGRYLEPAAGTTNWSIFAMAREGLRFELTDAFRLAADSPEPVVRRQLPVGTEAERHAVDLTVQLLRAPETLRGLMLVVFADSAVAAMPKSRRGGHTAASARIAVLEEQLSRAHAEVQALAEEARTVREDSHTASEELQSTNEELQSTNEELTTSKEEMQSMNEELQTLNRELQGRVDDLSRVSSDMRNLLESAEIATVFLDAQLRVRLFTAGSNRIFRLHDSDIGRPITDFASELDYPDLAADAREVFRTLIAREQEVTSRSGLQYLVRIMPYRTIADIIDGVAVHFTDITARRLLEADLLAARAALAAQAAAHDATLQQDRAPRGD